MTPILPLETFRRIIAYHPFHFWGLADNTVAPVTSKCNDVVYQYAWQNTDAVGRSEVLEAIENAERLLATQLGYWPAPHFGSATMPWPKHHDRGVWRLSNIDALGRWLDVRIPKEGHMQAVGVETRTLIGTPVLALTDEDGDGLADTFTLTQATTVTDPDQIAVYFQAADRLYGEGVSEKYRIAPVSISISGGTATIKGRSWLLVKPILYEGAGKQPIDPGSSSNFADHLDVYRRYADPDGQTSATSQAKLTWETEPYPAWALCCSCGSSAGNSSTDPAAVAEGVARAGIRDKENGIVNIGRAVYNSTTGAWESIDWGMCRPPERVTVRYQAGLALSGGEMDRAMQLAVARLAAAEMPRRINACDVANRELYRWQFDLARSTGNDDESYAFLPTGVLDNPFGTRRGHIYAWKFVQDQRNVVGMAF